MPFPTPTPIPPPPPLRDPSLRMRPADAPLPPSLQAHGGALAEVFARWLRQRDDAQHGPEKALLTRALASLPAEEVIAHARDQADVAVAGGWSHWHWAVPAATVASLLGCRLIDVMDQRRLHFALRAMAAGLSADADVSAIHRAGEAVEQLLAALHAAEASMPQAPLQRALSQHAPRSSWSDPDTFRANRLALIWQSHEAGAALLGHALQAMAPTAPGNSVQAPTLDALIAIARSGGAVRLTRRFRSAPAAAACPHHSPSHDSPSTLPTTWITIPLTDTDHPFGDGPHRCPGQDLALRTVHAALDWLSAQPALRWPQPLAPLVLPNMEIPQFPSVAMRDGDIVTLTPPTQDSTP